MAGVDNAMTPADSSHIDLRIMILPCECFVVILTKELIHRDGEGKRGSANGGKSPQFATQMSHDAAHHEKGAAAVGASRASLNRLG
jgi:hypothetical protein